MNIKGFEQSLEPFFSARIWWVAYSGGMDSHLLLVLLRQLLDSSFAQSFEPLPELKAIHVNHQLQAEAIAWEQHCQVICDALLIPLVTERVTIPVAGNLEALAREARYGVFSRQLDPEDVLLLGHHQDDQLETFFYRLLRGAGIKGLGAMAEARQFSSLESQSGSIVRPLLSYSRAELEQEAKHQGLSWVEDASNADVIYDRNFLRWQVLPLLKQRWPAMANSVTRVISHLQDHQQLLNELALEDLELCDVQWNEFWQEHSLAIDDLLLLSPLRSKNLLRHWLSLHNLTLSEKHNQLLWQALSSKKNDQKFVLQLADRSLRVFHRRLYLCQSKLPLLKGQVFLWQGEEALDLPGFARLLLSQPLEVNLTVRFREGGERCQLQGHKQHKSLKNLLQEAAIPPWHRNLMPLIYMGDELVAISDQWVLASAERGLGEENAVLMTRLSGD